MGFWIIGLVDCGNTLKRGHRTGRGGNAVWGHTTRSADSFVREGNMAAIWWFASRNLRLADSAARAPNLASAGPIAGFRPLYGWVRHSAASYQEKCPVSRQVLSLKRSNFSTILALKTSEFLKLFPSFDV